MENIKFSIIICSIDSLKFAHAQQNYKSLFKNTTYEIIGIHDAKSLAEGYNRGISQSSGSILIFSHDDIIVADDNFAEKISSRLRDFDLLGFAGATKVITGKWISTSNDYLRGVVAHALPKSSSICINVYGLSDWPVSPGIKIIDGLCMVATRHLVDQIQFDHKTFDGFHLYDLDFSFSTHLAGFNIGVCCDIPIIHESGGSFDEKYRDYSLRFENKYRTQFDPAEFARPINMPLGKSKSYKDTEELLNAWNFSSLVKISKSKVSWPADSFEQKYQDWLNHRRFISTDTKFLESQFTTTGALIPSFHFVTRLPLGFENLLADTIDSLGQQVHDAWRLDIVSTLPSPDGLKDLPGIGWRTLISDEEFKKSIDAIAKTSPSNWLIEIPPGARLDILYLWRLAYEIRTTPDAVAFFVDDDCCDDTGERFDPRLKPGVNIEALRSADLAGPICVRTDTWLASGGASQHAGSPWFEKLLQITDKYGWGSIKHIPDILITYLNHFPSNFESCHLALSASLKTKGIESEIRGVTSQSWGVRYTLNTHPAVTIAILSTGQFELAKRCLSSALKSTHYPNYEILIVTNKINDDPDFDHWLKNIQTQTNTPNIRVIYVDSDANYATRCNAAISSSQNELVVLSREETVFVQDIWLEELVAALQQTDIVAATPLIHQAGNANILASGQILGLLGEYGSPYSGKASLGETGYLDCLQVSKDTVALSPACFLIRKTAYQTIGGMDEVKLGDDFAEIDLCLKLHKNNHRLIVHPRSSVIYGFDSSQFDLKQRAEAVVKTMAASEALHQDWGSYSVVDPYWNLNLSICNAVPRPETDYHALWQYLPSNKPRILAHAIGNGQGDFRVTRPLNAARKAGLASECVMRQKNEGFARYFTATEICRLKPDSVIVQNYIHDVSLAVLKDWGTLKNRPFTIYTLDDLINDLDKTNPFRKHIPPNARSRFKYALNNCDRLVLSTEFLADTYRHFIDDIKVVPNRLEKDIWLPLNSKKRTSIKPRVGWAGGTTHEGDLILLKEIIEQTRDEVDWVFFGMCPETIRPLLAEFHELVSMDEYPAYLASLSLDIAVAPLAMTPFNQGKSNLRLLEYGALGIPVVCTDIDPYQNSPACRVKNSADAWVAALRERIYDVDAREKEGIAMRDWMYHSYLLEDHLDDWLSAHLPS